MKFLRNRRCAPSRRVALDKREGSVKGKVVLCSAGAPLRLPEKVEDQGSGNLTLNHLSVEDRSTNHRFGPDIDHDSSMRTSRRRDGWPTLLFSNSQGWPVQALLG